MNSYLKLYYGLCTPARIYFTLATLSLMSLIYQNLGNTNKYRVGRYTVNLGHTNVVLFLFKIVYILVWTFILNNLCKNGWGDVSWFLVLIPFIMLFIIIAIFLLANLKR